MPSLTHSRSQRFETRQARKRWEEKRRESVELSEVSSSLDEDSHSRASDSPPAFSRSADLV